MEWKPGKEVWSEKGKLVSQTFWDINGYHITLIGKCGESVVEQWRKAKQLIIDEGLNVKQENNGLFMLKAIYTEYPATFSTWTVKASTIVEVMQKHIDELIHVGADKPISPTSFYRGQFILNNNGISAT